MAVKADTDKEPLFNSIHLQRVVAIRGCCFLFGSVVIRVGGSSFIFHSRKVLFLLFFSSHSHAVTSQQSNNPIRFFPRFPPRDNGLPRATFRHEPRATNPRATRASDLPAILAMLRTTHLSTSSDRSERFGCFCLFESRTLIDSQLKRLKLTLFSEPKFNSGTRFYPEPE